MAPELRAGTDTRPLWLFLAFVFVVMCLALVMTVEFGYRQQRRWRLDLAKEITRNVAVFEKKLVHLTSPPPWDTRGE
jgi:hypothetical protein